MTQTETYKELEIRYKKKIKDLKNEISMLNNLLSESEGDWDCQLMYEDAFNGTFNGNKIEGFKPNKKFAEWIRKRYNLDKLEDSE